MDEQNTTIEIEKKVKKARVPKEPKEPKVPKEKKEKKEKKPRKKLEEDIEDIEIIETEPEPQTEQLTLELPVEEVENIIVVPEVPVEVPDTPPSPTTQDASTQTDEEICICCEQKFKRKKDDPEYWKNYYRNNKDKLKQQKKDWREKNPDRVNSEAKREYQKKYDAEHKEQINQRRKREITCECGEIVKQFSFVKHRKSKTHKLLIELKVAKGESVVPVEVETEYDDSSSSEEA